MKNLVFAVLLCVPVCAASRFDITHLDKITRVADPQISPDGKSIVVLVSHPNYTEDRYDADLVLVDISSGRRRALTHDRRGISSPRWTPAGDRLAFLATGANAKPQIFVMPMSGGDAVQITNDLSILFLKINPDSRSLSESAQCCH